MELFDKKFVYLKWDDVLKEKKVLVGDNLQLMRMEVNDGTAKLRCIKDNSNNRDLYPFEDDCGTVWSLIYYDPNYECKLAYAQGKVIQYRIKNSFGNGWSNADTPQWYPDHEYRVKPDEANCNTCQYQCEPDMPCQTCRDESNYKPRVVVHKKRRMTNRELAKWLAQANGERLYATDNAASYWTYGIDGADREVDDGVKIRGWDEEEWHVPEVEEE